MREIEVISPATPYEPPPNCDVHEERPAEVVIKIPRPKVNAVLAIYLCSECLDNIHNGIQ